MYDPNLMPANIDEWEQMISHYLNREKIEYNSRVEQTEAAARQLYKNMLASGEEPEMSLGEYMAQALSTVQAAKTRQELEQEFACYYPQGEPAFAEPELTPAQKLAQQRSQIDAETSAAILAGFDYEVNGQALHFSYDSFDQQNFADTANACLMAKSGAQGLPDTVTWNAYDSEGNLVRLTLAADEFLALYAGGALAHKAACMEAGGAKKAALGA